MKPQLTEIELSWNGTRFICEDKKIENHIFFKTRLNLFQNEALVTEFLQRCDFQLIAYKDYDGFKIQKSEDVFLDIADEGSGFNIVFNLAAIALLETKTSYIKNNKTDKFDVVRYLFDDHKNVDRIYIDSKSVKPNLHPLLFERIKEYMGMQCRFLSSKDVRHYLKCAVNPLGNCETCQHFKSDNNRIIHFR